MHVDKSQLECLNSAKDHPIAHALLDTGDKTYLESDSDAQILINIGFIAPVKLHHLIINTPANDSYAPKTLKIFANKLNMDFTQAEEDVPTQEIILSSKDFQGTTDVKFVKFQNLKTLTVRIIYNHL